MTIIYVGHVLKVSFFGAPLNPDDIYSFCALCGALGGIRSFYLVMPFALFAIVFAINFKIHKVAAVFSFFVMSIFFVVVMFAPKIVIEFTSSRFGYDDFQRGNCGRMGGTLFFVQECARASYVSSMLKAPSKEAVVRAIRETKVSYAGTVKPSVNKSRNVYIVVMESLWDASLLKKAKLSKDPFDPDFRKLWDETGNSYAMSPVFGGRTASAEFEVLMGCPANLFGEQVLFSKGIKNMVPALPSLLSRIGYDSFASHPNNAAFWNRFNVYGRFGFGSYYFVKNFKKDDMNGDMLSDESLYGQTIQMIDAQSTGKPKLVYIVTYSGHYPYLNNKVKRPFVISSGSAVDIITPYVNLLRYDTKEIMNFLKLLRSKDPDAIVVILGDHAPLLGQNFGAYVESDLLTCSLGEFTADMYRTVMSVPLIVIDGKNGPLNVGTVAMYEVPHIILKLLNYPELTCMELFKPPHGLHIRPLMGLSFVSKEDGNVRLCKSDDESETSKIISNWVERVRVFEKDLLMGKQHLLKEFFSKDK